MMDQLIDAVCAKTGLGQDQARGAVETVLGLLKSRLPASLAAGLDNLVGETPGTDTGSNSEEAGGEGGGLLREASSLLGNLYQKG